MDILVLSDIHDHVQNLRKVISKNEGKVQGAIFCGDMCAPFTAAVLAQLQVPIYACLGNNDEDHISLYKKGGEYFTWTRLSEEFGEIELDRCKIAFCHYPKLAALLVKTGDYDAVFCGHTHKILKEEHDKSLLLNPGAICGLESAQEVPATYALYNTNSKQGEILKIDN